MWLQPTSHYATTQKLRVSWADWLVLSSNPFRSPLGGERVSWEVKGGEVCWILRHSPLSSSSCLWRKESWIGRWSDKAPFHVSLRRLLWLCTQSLERLKITAGGYILTAILSRLAVPKERLVQPIHMYVILSCFFRRVEFKMILFR